MGEQQEVVMARSLDPEPAFFPTLYCRVPSLQHHPPALTPKEICTLRRLVGGPSAMSWGEGGHVV